MLLPCPFCGGTNIKQIDEKTYNELTGNILAVKIWCADCDVEMWDYSPKGIPYKYAVAMLEKKWNTRHECKS